MRFRILWHPAAVYQLKELGFHPAEGIDAAVIRFAETGQGDVEWVPPYYRLRVGVHRVRFTIDRDAREMHVLYVYRAR